MSVKTLLVLLVLLAVVYILVQQLELGETGWPTPPSSPPPHKSSKHTGPTETCFPTPEYDYTLPGIAYYDPSQERKKFELPSDHSQPDPEIAELPSAQTKLYQPSEWDKRHKK